MTQKKPRVLIWDLETGGVNAFYADLGFVLNFGYKWLGEKETHCLRVSDYKGWFDKSRDVPVNDRPLLEHALKIMTEADLLVAHYGDKFDRRFFQGRCVIQNINPPPPTIQRDTCKISWKAFAFRSNRLASLATHLGLKEKKYQKKSNEWPGWWFRAMAGNKQAIEEMAEYCKQDVRTLEQIYLRIRQYDNTHPRLFRPRTSCKTCGGNVIFQGTRTTSENIHLRFQCTDCGRWGHDTKAFKEKK